VSGPGVGTFHTGRVGGVRKRDMLVQGCTQTRNRVRGWAKGGRGACSTHGGGCPWGDGGAMCIAGSKGQDKEPNSLDPSTSTNRREHASTSQGRITRGRARGAPSLASKTRRTKTAAIRRRRARGRESGAGKGVQGMCARACGWLLGLFVDSYNPFHTESVTESHRSQRPPLLLGCNIFCDP